MTVSEAVPEIAEQGFVALLDRVAETGEPYTGQDVPIRLWRADGFETRYLDFIYQPMFGPDGRVNGVLGHGVDITQRRQAEARDRFFVELDLIGEVSAGRRLAGAAVDLLDRARAPAGEIEAARALQGTEVQVGGRPEES